MRKLDTGEITEAVAALCISANKRLPCDMEARLRGALQDEASPVGRDVLQSLLDNCAVARELDVPVCQDTGMATVFLEVGMEVRLTGAPLEEAVDAGVAKGYT
ncbi:MAG: fumarate hydratase, partial [Oscillospiraceae bacterium]